MRPLSVLLAFGVLACSRATSAPAPAAQQPSPAPGRQDTARAGGARPGGQAPAEGPKAYGQVITAQATTDSGVFIVHRIGEKLFYEIPRA